MKLLRITLVATSTFALGAMLVASCGGALGAAEEEDAAASPSSDGGCIYRDRWVPEGEFRGQCIGASTCCAACGCGRIRGNELEVICLGLLMRDGRPCSSEFDCTYGDAGHLYGETFPRLDGCGACRCDESGQSALKVKCDDTPCADAGDADPPG